MCRQRVSYFMLNGEKFKTFFNNNENDTNNNGINARLYLHNKKLKVINCLLWIVVFYELINNVKILEFGLIPHPKFKIFGASPDGICSNDSPKEFIGRMLEIKVPPKRKFTKTVPSHYGYQMQGQLECCDLEECDFLQVKIEEYDNEEDYLNDKYIYNGVLKEGYNSENYPKGCTLTYQKKDSLSYSYLYPELCLTTFF